MALIEVRFNDDETGEEIGALLLPADATVGQVVTAARERARPGTTVRVSHLSLVLGEEIPDEMTLAEAGMVLALLPADVARGHRHASCTVRVAWVPAPGLSRGGRMPRVAACQAHARIDDHYFGRAKK